MQPQVGSLGQRLSAIGTLWALLGIALTGCAQKPSDEELTDVAGKVTVAGKPLTNGSVTFHPDSGKGNSTQHIPVGVLDESGGYRLMSATEEGAPPGWYKVTVTAQAPIEERDPYAPPKHLIHPKYADVQTSGLSVEVVENPPPGAYDFEVTK